MSNGKIIAHFKAILWLRWKSSKVGHFFLILPKNEIHLHNDIRLPQMPSVRENRHRYLFSDKKMMDDPSLLKFAFWKTNVYDFYSSLMNNIIGVKSIIPFDFGRWRWKITFFPKSFLFWEKRSKEQTNFLWFLISSGPKLDASCFAFVSRNYNFHFSLIFFFSK